MSKSIVKQRKKPKPKPTPTWNPVWRPTSLTPDIIIKLEQAFDIWASDKEACSYADISMSAFYNYQDHNIEFKERKWRLKEKPILQARQEVVKWLKDNHEFSLKYLERKLPDEFSMKHRYEGEINVKGLLTEEEQQRINKLMADNL